MLEEILEERFDVFTSAITQISKDIQKIKTRQMRQFGLRGSHVMCLFYLQKSGGSLTVAELSAMCGMDKSAVSRTMSELEKEGLVTCPETPDKRKYRAKISFTEEGEKLVGTIGEIIDKTVERAGVGLSDEERAVFYKALLLISGNLNKMASSQIRDNREGCSDEKN